ncbi:MAG: DNRLRE domain-containing protein [bacterium]|nr:DNRLRE domain-containing protein [bacterium]
MKLIKSLIFSGLLLSVIFITGCNEAPVNPNESIDGGRLSKAVTSVRLHIFNTNANLQTVNIYAVSSDWAECIVTYNTQPTLHPGPEGSFVTDVNNDWIITDISGIYYKWVDGTYDNFGILLTSAGTNLERFDSKEGTNPPFIRITFDDESYEDIADIADTELNELYPDLNFCNAVYLYNGVVNGYEKLALLKFDVQYVPQVECETAYAFDEEDGTCFIDLGFGNWGWSIYLPAPGTYTFPVYAAAGQCDITKGTYVGDVTAVYANGTVTFTYDFEPGFSTEETHFYAGYTPVPRDKKGKPTVAPGQYKIGTGLSGGIYIIAHAVVCSSDWD